jgi:hypothetical protein
MAKHRKPVTHKRARYLAAAAATIAAGTTLAASPANAVGVPSFQQMKTMVYDSVVRSTCHLQVVYVSLANGTVTVKMNGQTASTNILASLGVKHSWIYCDFVNQQGDVREISNQTNGSNASTGVKYVTIPLSSTYYLCTYGTELLYNGTYDSVSGCTSSG